MGNEVDQRQIKGGMSLLSLIWQSFVFWLYPQNPPLWLLSLKAAKNAFLWGDNERPLGSHVKAFPQFLSVLKVTTRTAKGWRTALGMAGFLSLLLLSCFLPSFDDSRYYCMPCGDGHSPEERKNSMRKGIGLGLGYTACRETLDFSQQSSAIPASNHPMLGRTKLLCLKWLRL